MKANTSQASHIVTIRLSNKHLGEEIRKATVDIRNNKNKDIVLEVRGANKYIEAYVKPPVFGKHEQPFAAIADAFAEKIEKLVLNAVFLDNWEGLDRFQQLKTLAIQLENSDKATKKDFPPINFENYPYLEWFATWSLWNTQNLEHSKMKALTYIAYSQNKKDLTANKLPLQLKRLEIKHDALSSLLGVETAENLEEIELYHLRSLKDISALEKLKNLQFLFINKNCSKIDFDNFPYLPTLKKLYIDTNIPHLSFLQKMPNLEDFGFWKVVKDENIAPILHLNNLKMCYFKNKKGYSHTYEQICGLKSIVIQS